MKNQQQTAPRRKPAVTAHWETTVDEYGTSRLRMVWTPTAPAVPQIEKQVAMAPEREPAHAA